MPRLELLFAPIDHCFLNLDRSGVDYASERRDVAQGVAQAPFTFVFVPNFELRHSTGGKRFRERCNVSRRALGKCLSVVARVCALRDGSVGNVATMLYRLDRFGFVRVFHNLYPMLPHQEVEADLISPTYGDAVFPFVTEIDQLAVFSNH